MAYTPRTSVAENAVQTAAQAEIDIGLRRLLLSVYNYMATGLVLTGIVAYAAAESGLYAAFERTPLALWAVILAPLALVLFLSFRIDRMSLGAAQAAFWAYAGLIGVSLAGIFLLLGRRASSYRHCFHRHVPA